MPERGWLDLQIVGEAVEDAGTARVDDVVVEIRRVPAVAPREGVQGGGEDRHRAGDPAVQPEVEAGLFDFVRDPVLCVRDQVAGIAHQLHAGSLAVTTHHGCGDGVAEQPVGEQCSHVGIGRLVAQGAELTRHDQDVRPRIRAAEVVSPVDGTAAGGAAKLRDGDLPRVGPEPEVVDRPRGEGRHGETGARDEHDGVHITRLQLRGLECLRHGARNMRLRLSDVDLVTGFEPWVDECVRQRLHQVPFPDTGVGDHPCDEPKARVLGMQFLGQLERFFHGQNVFGDPDRGSAQHGHVGALHPADVGVCGPTGESRMHPGRRRADTSLCMSGRLIENCSKGAHAARVTAETGA